MAEPRDRYSLISIFLHWAIAGFVVWNILLGWSMEDLPPTERFGAFQLHKSIGLTVLTLSLIRLGWRLANPAPPLPRHMAGWERVLARGTHVLFYVLIIGIPLGGWAAVSASPYNIPTLVWGVIPWPDLPLPDDKALSERIGGAHGAAVWLAIATLVLHVAGALKHQFLDRDQVLWRMLPVFPKPKERS